MRPTSVLHTIEGAAANNMSDILDPDENVPFALPDRGEFLVAVPLWATRAVVPNGGVRYKKIPRTQPTYAHADDDEGYDYCWGFPWGPAQKPLTEEWKGNLTENDYRYWVGCRTSATAGATCRWCHRWFVDDHDRKEHHKHKYCAKLLSITYRYATKHASKSGLACFVCGAVTKHQRWGVPLCLGGDGHPPGEGCRTRWKFDSTRGFSMMQGVIEICRKVRQYAGYEEESKDAVDRL